MEGLAGGRAAGHYYCGMRPLQWPCLTVTSGERTRGDGRDHAAATPGTFKGLHFLPLPAVLDMFLSPAVCYPGGFDACSLWPIGVTQHI